MRMKGWSLSMTIIGLVLVIFSLVWLLAIFPGMVKLPEDHHRDINFEGTYYVLNPDTQTLDEIPVLVERLQDAMGVQDNVITISETVTCTHALAGMELEQFGAYGEMNVDRSTRAFVANQADGMPRSGQFCFPSDLEQESYSLWVLNAGRPLEAAFTGEEEFHGLTVYDFAISEQDLDIGAQEGTGIPQVLDIDISLKVEPVTGTTVYTASNSTYSMVVGPETKMPYYISNIAFNDDTIDYLVDDAQSNRSLILWLSVYGFWIAIVVGAALVVTGVVMAIRNRE
jgi:hypothetical protein